MSFKYNQRRKHKQGKGPYTLIVVYLSTASVSSGTQILKKTAGPRCALPPTEDDMPSAGSVPIEGAKLEPTPPVIGPPVVAASA